MAITDTKQAKEFTAGAPDITLKGDLNPNKMMASYGYDDAMGEAFEEFLRLKKIKEIPADMEFDEYLDLLDIDIPYSKKQEQDSSIKLAELDYDNIMKIEDKAFQNAMDRFKYYQDMKGKKNFRDYLREAGDEGEMFRGADGGRANYGLGSLVKSVKKAVKGVAKGVKNVVKSDLGKAALLIGGGMYAGGLGPFAAAGRFGTLPGAGFLGSLSLPGIPGIPGLSDKGKGTLAAFAIGSLGSAAISAAEAGGLDTSDPNAEVDIESLKGYLSKGYKNLNPNATDEEVFQFVQENTAEYRANGGRIGYSDGTPSFEEYMRERKGIEQKMNMEKLYKEYLEDLRRKKVAEDKTMAAMGGRIGYAMGDTASENAMQAAGIEGLPVRQNKAGVTELDLRETGGFVPPVGVKEKADDIPAMLSNNEFVFTADAVRAAGGGDIDKGAQLMYDTMKRLESRVV